MSSADAVSHVTIFFDFGRDDPSAGLLLGLMFITKNAGPQYIFQFLQKMTGENFVIYFMGDRRVSLARAHAPNTSAARPFSNLWWGTQKVGDENRDPCQEMQAACTTTMLVPKEELTKILREKRRIFVEAHFERDIRTLSESLLEDANKMEDSPRELIVRVPKALEPTYVEKMLLGYVRDHGYNACADVVTRPGDREYIRIALT